MAAHAMMQIMLAALAAYLAHQNALNPPLCVYWVFVFVYWVLNYLNQNGRKDK